MLAPCCLIPSAILIIVSFFFLFHSSVFVRNPKTHTHLHSSALWFPFQVGGLVFGVVLGAITGYFNAAVGLLYVISGTLGLIAASGCKRRAVSLLVCPEHFLSFHHPSVFFIHVLDSFLS